MKIRVELEVDATQLDRLAQLGVRLLGGHEEPRKSWTDKERAQMARAYLSDLVKDVAEEKVQVVAWAQ